MCYAQQSAVPVEVALYHRPDDLPPIGDTVRWTSTAGGPRYEAEVIGYSREYSCTRVHIVLHATTCPARCVNTRLRLSEVTDVVPGPPRSRIVV